MNEIDYCEPVHTSLNERRRTAPRAVSVAGARCQSDVSPDDFDAHPGMLTAPRVMSLLGNCHKGSTLAETREQTPSAPTSQESG